MPKAKKTTLREARIERGLSIEGLAKKAGIPYSTAQAVESGRLAGSLMAKMKLVDALGLSLRDLWPETYAEVSALLAEPERRRKRNRPPEQPLSGRMNSRPI